eukprot:5264460-Alexandrium_andersonii.AAC.1
MGATGNSPQGASSRSMAHPRPRGVRCLLPLASVCWRLLSRRRGGCRPSPVCLLAPRCRGPTPARPWL